MHFYSKKGQHLGGCNYCRVSGVEWNLNEIELFQAITFKNRRSQFRHGKYITLLPNQIQHESGARLRQEMASISVVR